MGTLGYAKTNICLMAFYDNGFWFHANKEIDQFFEVLGDKNEG